MHGDSSTARLARIANRARLDNPPPAEHEKCFICGKYGSICHWHHVLPVREAAEILGSVGLPSAEIVSYVDHMLPMVSLCPTHHRLFHALEEKDGFYRHRELLHDLSSEERTKFKELANEHARVSSDFLASARKVKQSFEDE